jgi:SAM-dependent methyltransferase
MKISFAMTAFQKELYINDAITSILAQDYKDIELVIVDDASTDGTQDICEYYAKLHPDKIKYIRNKKNLGVGKSRNIAWEHATGDIICVNDADDASLSHRARLTAETFKKNNVDIAYGGCVAINHKGEQIPNYRLPEKFNLAKLKIENFIQHPTVAYRRSIPVRYRPVRFIDDWYFYLDCVAAGMKFGTIESKVEVENIMSAYRLIHDGLTQDGGFYHEEKEKAKAKLRKEFENYQQDITEPLKKDLGQQTRINAILREIPKGSSVLDIGCNAGYIMERIKKKGCSVVGVEIANNLVEKCKQRGLNVKKEDVLNIKIKSHIDVILIGDVLEHYHIEHVSKIVNNLLSHCKKLIITVPYKYGQHSARENADHVRDYDIDDFKQIMGDKCKVKSKVILVGDNAVPDWLLITGEK